MSQLKTFLVVNPRSGNGLSPRQLERLANAVRAAVGPFQLALTEGPMHAATLTRAALKEGHECVVAVGGDGTVNEVVNGFFEDGAPVRPGAALGIVPWGTGGDFRRVLGWSNRLEEAVARLRGDATRALDLGRVDFVSNDGRPASRYFVNVASAGVSGEVDLEVNRTSKALGGTFSFALGTLRALARYRDRRIRLAFDGGPERETNVTAIAVANGQYFGGGMWVAPTARPDDGVFDVTLWSGYRLWHFALLAPKLYNGRHVQLTNTTCSRARVVRMESDETVLLDIDGEQPGRLPARIELLPRALRLKV